MAKGNAAIALSEESAAAARALSGTSAAEAAPASFDLADFSGDEGTGSIPSPVTAATLALAACGGGGGGGGGAPPPPPPPAAIQPTRAQAARFLGQAAVGASKAHIEQIAASGFEAWLDQQFAMPRAIKHWDWLVQAGYSNAGTMNSEQGFDPVMWRQLIASNDTAARARRHGAARSPRRRDRRRHPALAAIRLRGLCRHPPRRRLRQFPRPADEHLHQRGDGRLSHLPRQPEGERRDRRGARRELRPRADAALHHRPAAAQHGRHAAAGERRCRSKPIRRTTLPASRASSPAGTSPIRTIRRRTGCSCRW